jgi:hypothetical protein
MTHSNHYYRQIIKETGHIDLLARHEVDEQLQDINCIQMIVHGPVYGTTMTRDVGIWLSEKEQDDLIAGILERRGYKLYIDDDLNAEIKLYDPITAERNEQSRIHPHKLPA